MIKQIFTSSVLLLAIGCNSPFENKTPITPPSKNTYGVFRTLTPKALRLAKNGLSTVNTATVNISSRVRHRSIQMLDGRILIVGGDQNTTPSMDIYDPSTETFTKSQAVPYYSRYAKLGSFYDYSYTDFCLINLPDGRVFLSGSPKRNGVGNDRFEIYDPIADTLTVNIYAEYKTVGPISHGFYIGNNRLLLFEALEGRTVVLTLNSTGLSSIEYEEWANPPSADGLVFTSTIQDSNGNIYVIGGTSYGVISKSIWKYTLPNIDFPYGLWAKQVDMNIARYDTSLLLLPGNKIGIYGGKTDLNNSTISSASVEIFDIPTNKCSLSTNLVGDRSAATATYLQTGYVLVAGGVNSYMESQDTQLVHNNELLFSGSTGIMTTARKYHSSVGLSNGLVLITGGEGSTNSKTSGELFDPQAALYISYKSEQMALGSQMQFNSRTATSSVIAIWSVDNTEVALIDSNGLLTSLKEGLVTVKATFGTDTAIARIKIIPE